MSDVSRQSSDPPMVNAGVNTRTPSNDLAIAVIRELGLADFLEHLDAEVRFARSAGTPLSLVMFDVDGFGRLPRIAWAQVLATVVHRLRCRASVIDDQMDGRGRTRVGPARCHADASFTLRTYISVMPADLLDGDMLAAAVAARR